jgi:hypothetical protein
VPTPLQFILLSTETLECISTGSEFSRLEKTLKMSKVPDAHNWLNVCISPDVTTGKNCSVCPKCCRTLLTLEVLGITDEFKNVFNLDKWQRIRRRYVITGLAAIDKDPYIKEIVSYAEKNNFSFKTSDFVAAKILKLRKSVM